MRPLSETLNLGDGRRASFEVIGDGTPLLYFQGGPGLSAALLRDDYLGRANQVIDRASDTGAACGHRWPSLYAAGAAMSHRRVSAMRTTGSLADERAASSTLPGGPDYFSM